MPSSPSALPPTPPPPAAAAPRLQRRTLEKITLVHVGVMLLFAAWAFGGNIEWARRALSWCGTLALPITIAALRYPDNSGRWHRWRWLIPWALYVSLVAGSCLNPSFTTHLFEGQELSIHLGEAHPGLPSTVSPHKTLHELWFSATVYLAGFNLLLTVRRRRMLRGLLVIVGLNTLLLSILGTVQKLAGKDLYFGAIESPNKRFFATFIYNNHWGAFMILTAAPVIGLLFYWAQNHRGRDFWHSPAPATILGVFLILVTAPVSASRAATGMSALLIGGAALHGLTRILGQRRGRRESAAPAITGLLALLLAASTGTAWLARDSIRERFAETRDQLQGNTVTGSRLSLYEDTWSLVRQKPFFGWGLESYGTAFQLIRPRPLEANRQYEASYVAAHSDWLQSLAETGFAGTSLIILMMLAPLSSLRLQALRSPLVGYPLAGCALIALYAWVDFPLGNGAVQIACCLSFFSAIRYAQLATHSESSD